jgi:hypothetical protein
MAGDLPVFDANLTIRISADPDLILDDPSPALEWPCKPPTPGTHASPESILTHWPSLLLDENRRTFIRYDNIKLRKPQKVF